MTDDLFDEVPQYGLNKGGTRYKFPAPPGETVSRWGFLRASNIARILSDQDALHRWRERLILAGLQLSDGVLWDELPFATENYEVDKIAESAFLRAGGDVGARRGTAAHLSLEGYMVSGVPGGNAGQRERTEAVLKVLDAEGFELIPGSEERRVWHPLLGGVMGTRDARVLERASGHAGIADLKTGKKVYSYLEFAIQEYLYDSATWEWHGPPDGRGRWVPTEPNMLLGHRDGKLPGQRVALIIHHPFEGRPEIHEVSLQTGQAAALLAAAVINMRAEGKSAGGLRP